MNKKQLDILEKCFEAEINGDVHVTKSKTAIQLEADGYIQKASIVVCRDRFGELSKEGYVTTILGNMTYCQSDRCLNDDLPI